MGKPVKYTKVKVIKLSENQFNTLKKLEDRHIRVSDFIRNAIKEKIHRDYSDLKQKPKKEYCPF